MNRDKLALWPVWVASVALITVMYYATQNRGPWWLHNVLQHLYFAPIAAAAIRSGVVGGLGTAVLASVCFAPHVVIELNQGLETRRFIGSEATEVVDLVLVGLIAGLLADRERKQKESLQQTTSQLNAVYQELQRNFERMKRSERLYAIGQLSAGLAHEIRNPLASIGGAASILKKNASEERRHEFLDIIEKESERLNRLLTSFIDFARPRAPQYQSVDIGALVRSVIDLASHAIGRKPVRIHTEFCAELPPVTCDPEQMKQVMLNLTINAIQAMPTGGDIVVSTHKDSTRITIEVKDNGAGIRTEHLDSIFDPFFTTKDTGSGLGLSVAHQIVTQHGGVLTAKNNPHNGATFSVSLPLTRGVVL
ncbi:MAG: sensor histidine kinase [Acidobacteria bacterium]|nr:sensor histidine kinase [Acidobacteriota bacterium]